jgi:hypothetical protein
MKPPDNPTTWYEPPYFKLRTTTRAGWMVRAMIVVVVRAPWATENSPVIYHGDREPGLLKVPLGTKDRWCARSANYSVAPCQGLKGRNRPATP